MPSSIRLSFARPSKVAALAVVVSAIALASCSTRRPAPVEERAPPAPSRVAPSATIKPALESDWRPPTYTVKRGDTLYAIALDHGLDYRDIVAWNAIENPNLIRVGQVIRLSPQEGISTAGIAGAPDAAGGAVTGVVTAPLRGVPPVVETRPGGAAPPAASGSTSPGLAGGSPVSRQPDNLKTWPKAVKEPYSPQAARELAKVETPPPVVIAAAPSPSPAPVSAAAKPEATEHIAAAAPAAAPSPAVPSPPVAAGQAGSDDEGLDWVWPAKGKVVSGYSETANLKGIDISGTMGQPVVASAPGKVVYAGTGLRGYGKLVIIKHNKTFLSAYAHNKEILVKEGQQVARGQKIAEMGNSDADQVKLHFEIRRLGKPMDPAKYLPPA